MFLGQLAYREMFMFCETLPVTQPAVVSGVMFDFQHEHGLFILIQGAVGAKPDTIKLLKNDE
jgi:hypothetical protein